MIKTVYDLRCENLINPIGIDAPSPRLSWRVVSQDRGAFQKAFRILISSSIQNAQAEKADILDTGFIQSSDFYYDCVKTEFASRSEYFWTVQILDEKDNLIKSDTAQFETAFYEPE